MGFALLLSVFSTLMVSAPAAAQTPTTFWVTIESVQATSNFDGPFPWDRADFFAQVHIDAQIFESPVISNDDTITPDWQFSRRINVVDFTNATIPISIEILDADDFGNRQTADLTPDSDRLLTLTIDVSACTTGTANAVTGSVTGACGQTLVSAGTDSQNTAIIHFRIEAFSDVSFTGRFTGSVTGDGGSSAPVTATLTQSGSTVSGSVRLDPGLIIDFGCFIGARSIPDLTFTFDALTESTDPHSLRTDSSFSVEGVGVALRMTVELSPGGETLNVTVEIDLPVGLNFLGCGDRTISTTLSRES